MIASSIRKLLCAVAIVAVLSSFPTASIAAITGGAVAPPTGCGPDTAFPGTISSVGTSLGAVPAICATTRGVEIDIPPGATVAYYVATSQAASAAAALAVAHSYYNPLTATTPYPLPVNLTFGQLVWVTFASNGAAGTYISGAPTFRWL